MLCFLLSFNGVRAEEPEKGEAAEAKKTTLTLR